MSLLKGRENDPHLRRRHEVFLPFVAGAGLEIGPAIMPTFPKSDGWTVKVLDHLDQHQLRTEYTSSGSVADEIDRIEQVDIVVADGRSYLEAVGHQKFDFVVACHVIEHTPDLVEFLRSCALMLRSGGSLLLAVPTRELSFDFYRPLSTLGDVVLAHHQPEAHGLRARIDSLAMDANFGGDRVWIPETLETHLRSGNIPQIERSPLLDTCALERLDAHDSLGVSSWFGHRWIFEPGQFVWLLDEIRLLFSVPLRLIDIRDGIGSEFLVVLQFDPDALEESDVDQAGSGPGLGARTCLGSRKPVLPSSDPAIYSALTSDLLWANDAVQRQLEHHRKLLAEARTDFERLQRRKSVRLALGLVELVGRWRRR